MSNRKWLLLAGLAAAALLLGAGVQAVGGQGSFWIGWLAASGLLFLSGLGLAAAWRWGGGTRGLAWMVLLAFCLRLGLGVASEKLLPVYGYPETEQQAGYLSKDAFSRDNQAWGLARSGQPLWDAFGVGFTSDQYGGMLALSAGTYRLLSPDGHRPALIVILSALAAALGVPFAFKAGEKRFGRRAGMLAGWLLALYPEAIFWGASQMREPFLISALAVALWGALELTENRRGGIIGLAAGLGGLLFFSPVIAAAAASFLTLLAGLYLLSLVKDRAVRWGAGVVVLVGCLALAWLGWGWLQSRVQWDASLTEESSGWVQKVIEPLGEAGRIPAITAYGIMRPVLPAALADPAAPFWRAANILRAAGWYALLPLLAYGLLAAWRAPQAGGRRLLTWLALAGWVWVLIASARGGGDGSDNPRYRVIFLAWQALLAGWAWSWAREQGFRWLGRLLAVEGIFLVFFTEWYLSRYTRLLPRLPFYPMVGIILGLNALVIVGGWAWDRKTRWLTQPPEKPDQIGKQELL